MSENARRPPPEPVQTTFQRFTDFAKRLMQVPKAEIDEKAREYERQKKARQRRRAT
jgi:hypothetical protein